MLSLNLKDSSLALLGFIVMHGHININTQTPTWHERTFQLMFYITHLLTEYCNIANTQWL